MTIPEQGQLVQVRNRHFVVLDVAEHSDNGKAMHKVTLECLDDDALGDETEVIWQREIAPEVFSISRLPRPEEWDALGRFAAYTSALRWSSNSLVGGPPLTAPFFGAVEIEPYQLVPVVRALTMNRVSLLLADDVGLGKTIEAALTTQELIRRHRARRIMIVCPASLQRQWREEMGSKFSLDFHILDRQEIERLRKEYGIHVNPWNSFPRIITSMDFIKREQPLAVFRESLQTDRHAGLRDWDLLIVDEAHNCAPAGGQNYHRDSDRTKMLAELKGHFEHRLFLTATPHNGFTASFTALLEMLDPLRFSRGTDLDQDALGLVMIRRLKDQIVDDLGSQRFARRKVPAIELELTETERRALELLDSYIESRMSRAGQRERMAVQFALTILKKRLLSSPEAFYCSLETHVQTLREQAQTGDLALVERMKERAEQDWDDDEEKARMEAAALQEATRFFENLTARETEWLQELIEIADDLRGSADTKAETLIAWIEEHLRNGARWTGERLLIFTEYRDTLRYLHGLLQAKGWDDRILLMTGGMTLGDRQAVNDSFQASPDEHPVRILLGTDAASEGLNLQKHCRYLIHYEIPWNPTRMEQRNGRIDRHGQNADVVYCHHFLYSDHADRKFLEVIVEKVETQRADLGAVGDVIAEEVERAMLRLSDRIRDPKDRRQRVEQELREDLELEREVREIVEQITQTRKDWNLYPEQMAHVLHEALQMAGAAGLEAVEGGDAADRAYRIEVLPASWRDLNRFLVNQRGDRLAITFDNDLARDRTDVTLLHLGHPLMQRAIATFRACLWEDFAGDRPGLHRCSYKVLPDQLVSGPGVIAYGRLMAVSQQGRVLHEDIVTVGANISGRDLFPVDDQSIDRILDAEAEHRPISKETGARLRQLFPAHEARITEMFEELEAREGERLKEVLKKKAGDVRKDTRDLINQRIREIRKRLRQVESEAEQEQLRLLDVEEREQYDQDIRYLSMRLEDLERDRETEPDAAAESFALKSVRVFPVGLLYVLPESMVS